MKNKINCKMRMITFAFLAALIMLLPGKITKANGSFDAWYNSDKWDIAGDAKLNPKNNRRLTSKPGTGVLINGKEGKCPSLVTKRRDYRDVEIHVEFMVAKGSNSGVIFHGNYEIQILDSYGVKKPTAGHCGGVYPRAESKPTYHHIDKGSPPRVNAAKPPGQWQTMDIIFQSPRFDKNGNKTTHARFVKVVHNGKVIQEHVEVPYACGPNWDRKQYPQGPIIIQGDYGPIAVRNLRIREWKADKEKKLNVPPEGFTSLFNGRDFTGWRVHPKVKKMWSIEDGVLKSPDLLEQWGADLQTIKEYKDFVLLADFRMPSDSDSGIHFRKLIPDMGFFGQTEQLNIGSRYRMGQLESIGFMRANKLDAARRLKESDIPKVKQVDPTVGNWHTVKITMIGRTLSAELDGEIFIDKYEYPQWHLSTEAAPIRFQKHRFLEDANSGKKNPCPIEYRNIFIKEIATGASKKHSKLNIPPEGFTALFNGRDFTGWHTPPLVKEYWSIENGVLKSPGLIENWGASLRTKKHYRDFILMLDFRMPTISDSGITFRRLIPEIPGFGDMEQFNLRSRGGMGHLESYYFLPKETAKKIGLREEEKPHVRHIDPEVGVWHTVKLTMKGRTFSAEYDGEVLYDNFEYHDWMMNAESAPIVLQKHIVVHGDNLGKENPCPIEYRNIFIKEIESSK
ncbi:MAG: 3-keto-disaccharide hydrolase [Planctomycetota bacterium]|jgi:hypothetical protein